jgi:hypothetical protein
MRNLIDGLILSIFICCLLSTSTSAYHPHQKVAVFGYVCDSREQAESLPKAHKEGGYEAAIVQYKKLRATFNSVGEPVCAFSNREFIAELVIEIAFYADLAIPGEDGALTRKTFYVIEARSVANGMIAYVVTDEGISPPAVWVDL